jgi:hypothetical protein
MTATTAAAVRPSRRLRWRRCAGERCLGRFDPLALLFCLGQPGLGRHVW